MTKKLIGVVTLFVIILNACSYPSAYKWKLSSQSNTQWISEDGTIVFSVNENHSVTGIMEVNGEVIEIYVANEPQSGAGVHIYPINVIEYESKSTEDEYEYWICSYKSEKQFVATIKKTTFYEVNQKITFKQMEIIDSGKYYRIYKGNINQVCYDIYNFEGEIVLSEKTDRPLEINMINDDIIDIEIGMGTGITIHKYYSVGENIFSQEFPYVLSNLGKLIAYIDVPKEKPLENRKVIVQNIFDKSLFYKEFQLDFSNVDTPVIEAKFSKDGESLQLTYLSGEEQTRISTTLDLTQGTVLCVE